MIVKCVLKQYKEYLLHILDSGVKDRELKTNDARLNVNIFFLRKKITFIYENIHLH